MSELISAARIGNIEGVEEALRAGADPNQQDEHGWTPLCYAAGGGSVALVDRLLAAGADPARAGKDQRTPYQIALAAARVDAARRLRSAGGADAEPMAYCKAYPIDELRQFPPFAGATASYVGAQSADPEDAALDGIVFIHQDFTVTECIWHAEQVLFDEVTPAWREFCAQALGFRVPDELELAAEYAAATRDNPVSSEVAS
jgi:ankyrin repeat protein